MPANTSPKPTHRPEPWTSHRAADEIAIIAADKSLVYLIADDRRAIPFKEDQDRIVACVNACAGIADPQGAISTARDSLHLALAGLGDAISQLRMLGANVSFIAPVAKDVDAALAALGGGK